MQHSPDRGATAFWGSTTLVDPTPQEEVYRALLVRIPAGGTIGEAILDAQRASWVEGWDDHDVARSWVLLGDPATRLR